MSLSTFLLVLLGTSCLGQVPSDYLISDLPDVNGTISFKQYAGYMPLSDVDETSMFFWFVESQDKPTSDPVALWLNGGPGSSSIAYGFWTEHGPFRLQENAAGVNLYNYPWNLHASIIYLESPSGVGFSYSNKSSGYNCNDNKTANINRLFLEKFFTIFTDFSTQDLFLTGESYGGHYIPQLAQALLDTQSPLLSRMKGFWIGNPGINSDWYYNSNEYAFQTYLWSHALLPQDAWVNSNRDCQWDLFLTDCSKDFTNPDAVCKAANTEAYKYVPSTWDPYDIYAPTCHTHEQHWKQVKEKWGWSYATDTIKEMTPFLYTMKEKYNINTEYVYNPCMNQWTPEYMNREDVLKAINAYDHYTRTWPHHPAGWSYGSEKADIALLFPNFPSNWRIYVVSGDADSAVPFVGTQRWIECLDYNVSKDWFNWYMNEDVAGSVKIWDRITFQTIKECGHTIPTYCPQAGYEMFASYLSGEYDG